MIQNIELICGLFFSFTILKFLYLSSLLFLSFTLIREFHISQIYEFPLHRSELEIIIEIIIILFKTKVVNENFIYLNPQITIYLLPLLSYNS